MINRTTTKTIALAMLALAAAATPAWGQAEFFLRAEAFTMTMPDGQEVTMWGFAQDSAFGAADGGDPTCPGPTLVVPPGENTLIIHLDNNLPEAISLVIPGQTAVMTPVRLGAEQPTLAGRVRAFTHETAAGNTVDVTYTWTNVRPGSFIYHSGSHPAIQVQMGLYGAMTKLAAAGEVYAGVNFDQEVMIFYSEVDPVIHAAVAAGAYGPGYAVTSPVNYRPQYFLLNGAPYEHGVTAPLDAGAAGDTVLVRFFNAGLRSHSPMPYNLRMTLLAEDGYPYNNTQDRQAITVEALKTKDVLIAPADAGTYAVIDRAMALTNAASAPGGLIAQLLVAVP